MDRFALNAMIERLLESDGYDDEAREAVASFSSGMRRSSRYRFYSHISKPGDKVSGQTNLGTVEVENDKRVEKEISLGAREERIGQYKLYRHRRTLDIVHFWKSEITSASDTELAQAWRLYFDRKDRPVWFGERAVQRVFTIPLGGQYFEIVVNREVYFKRWGATGPEVRHGGWAILMELST